MGILRILHLEDDFLDAAMVRRALSRAGIDSELVLAASGAEFRAALEGSRFDLIISDYQLPAYNGKAALDFARQKAPATPFIFFSALNREDVAGEGLGDFSEFIRKEWPDQLVAAVKDLLKWGCA